MYATPNLTHRKGSDSIKYLGLYIHIPFCVSKCAYCDFYSMRATEKARREYFKCLYKQLEEYRPAAAGYSFDSVYIGGGTPTAVDSALLVGLLKRIRKNFRLIRYTEITVEVNPGTVDLKYLKRLFAAGVNRLSIGLQSASDGELAALSRIHTFAVFAECFKNAREAGFKNISVDLMYGIPGQTADSFMRTLKTVKKFKPEHISLYGLKIEEGTKFYEKRYSLPLPNEEEERAMYFYALDFLRSAGYSQYEISNFSLPEKECRHNLKYWNCEEYLGLGVAAHSYFSGFRFSFKKDLRSFIKNFGYDRDKLEAVGIFDYDKYNLFDEHMEIRPNERIGEYVMLAFRLSEGINLNRFAKLFYRDFEEMYLKKIAPFIESGHIIRTEKGYALTPDGMYVSNYILSRIVDFE